MNAARCRSIFRTEPLLGPINTLAVNLTGALDSYRINHDFLAFNIMKLTSAFDRWFRFELKHYQFFVRQ